MVYRCISISLSIGTKTCLISAYLRCALCGYGISPRSSRPLKMKTLVAFFGLLALANGQCCMGGTLCPAGCCPEADWFCCENNWQCAPTPADCCSGSYEECYPAENQHQLLKVNGERIFDVSTEAHQILQMDEERCCPGGTDCPAGCCPYGQGWFCCSDNMYCAATEAECP